MDNYFLKDLKDEQITKLMGDLLDELSGLSSQEEIDKLLRKSKQFAREWETPIGGAKTGRHSSKEIIQQDPKTERRYEEFAMKDLLLEVQEKILTII